MARTQPPVGAGSERDSARRPALGLTTQRSEPGNQRRARRVGRPAGLYSLGSGGLHLLSPAPLAQLRFSPARCSLRVGEQRTSAASGTVAVTARAQGTLGAGQLPHVTAQVQKKTGGPGLIKAFKNQERKVYGVFFRFVIENNTKLQDF